MNEPGLSHLARTTRLDFFRMCRPLHRRYHRAAPSVLHVLGKSYTLALFLASCAKSFSNYRRIPTSSAPKIESRAIMQYLHNRRGNRSRSRFPASASSASTFNFSVVFSSLIIATFACICVLKSLQKRGAWPPLFLLSWLVRTFFLCHQNASHPVTPTVILKL